jgi:RNA recognition motif-containing protein
MKSAIEKLNNKSIEKNKLLVKEAHYSNNNQKNNYPNYNNNYYGKQRSSNFRFIYPPLSINSSNFIPMQKFEDTLINNNLYITNIPRTATKEDLEKTFGQYGEIENIRLDEDNAISKEAKEKQKFFNKGFGYVSFKKVEDAKKAIESLDGKYLIGFETHYKNLNVEYFVPKEKRNMSQGTNFIPMAPGSMLYPNLPAQYMMPIPMNINSMPNNQMRFNNKNMGHRRGGNYRGRGMRGNKNNQKRNNNTGKNMNKKEEEKKNEFDHENFNKLKTDDEKRDFLGEKLFNLIQENKITKEKNGNEDEVGRITGMILAIPNMNEIIEILESPSKLEERINEAYDLIEKSK